MRNHLKNELGRLASTDFQDRFCVRGTVSEYVLPSEMLDGAANAVETVLSSTFWTERFTASEIAALREFLNLIEGCAASVPFNNPEVSNDSLIHRDPAWSRIRVAAKRCLDALGLSPSLDELLKP